MSTLLPLSQVIDRPLAGADAAEPPAQAATSTPAAQAIAQLQATIALHGVAPHNVEAIVLDAGLGPETIGTLCRHLVQLKCLYLVGDPGLHASAFANTRLHLAPPQLEPQTCWWLDTGVERHRANNFDEYSVLAQQLQKHNVNLRGLVVTRGQTPGSAAPLWDVAEDLRFHFGEQFFSAFASIPSQETGLRQALVRFLDTWSDYLFSQRDYLQALRAYLVLYHQNADPGLARLIAASWQELACPDLALDWLGASRLAKTEHDEVSAELREAQRRGRAREREQRTLNLRFIEANFKEWSSYFEALPSAEDYKLAWLRAHAWVLRHQTTPLGCVGEDYPALVRIRGAQLQIINPPLSPHTIGPIVTGPGQSASLAVDNATQIDLIYNVLRCRQSMDPGPRPQAFPDLFVLHDDAAQLAALFSACDLRALFATGTTKLLIGGDPQRDLCTTLAAQPDWPLPRTVPDHTEQVVNAASDELVRTRRHRGEAAWRRFTSRHGHGRLDRCQAQLQSGGGLRIWVQESWRTELEQSQFSGLERALTSLGHICRRSGRPRANAGLNFIATAVDEFDPDVVICGEDRSGLVAAARGAIIPVVEVDLRSRRLHTSPCSAADKGEQGYLLATELDGHEAKYVEGAQTHNIIAVHSTGGFDTGNERAMLDALLAANLPLTIYGGHWANEPGYRAYARPNPANGVEEITTLAGHSLHIFTGNDACLQHRALRAALCGTLVVEYCPEHPSETAPGEQLDLWLVPAREFLRAETPEQVLAHVQSAINEPELRSLIATASREKVTHSHSYAARANQVLQQFQRSIDTELRRLRRQASA